MPITNHLFLGALSNGYNSETPASYSLPPSQTYTENFALFDNPLFDPTTTSESMLPFLASPDAVDTINLETNAQDSESLLHRPIEASSSTGLGRSHRITKSSSPQKRSSPTNAPPASISSSTDKPEDQLVLEKRQRNTMAARRCRQRKEDRIARLEMQLKMVTKERDDLRLQVARLQGENMALKKVVADSSTA